MKSKYTAIIWCFFLGWLGVHKFYLGETGWGILYLLFCGTGIPAFAAFIEFIMLLVMSNDEFDRKFNGAAFQSTILIKYDTPDLSRSNRKFNSGASTPTASVKDSTSALSDLKRLYDEGVITAEEYEEKRKKLLKNI